MSYTDTFILVAEDCPEETGVVPATRGEARSVARLEYESFLSAHPYRFTEDELRFQVHVRREGLAPAEAAARGAAIRAQLCSKPHACLRASALPKRWGWGVHYDEGGRIAIYARGSADYDRLTSGGPKQLPAMRNRRG